LYKEDFRKFEDALSETLSFIRAEMNWDDAAEPVEFTEEVESAE
jgi:hypothetical protein